MTRKRDPVGMTRGRKLTERSAPSPILSAPSTPRRYAIYARVSTTTQRERETIQSQLSVLPEFVQRLGGELVATYIDDGVSGAAQLTRRPETRRMLDDAMAGRFDTLAIVALDRLTRADDWIDRAEVLGRLQRAGVTIAEYETGATLDLRDPSGDLIASLRTSWGGSSWARTRILCLPRSTSSATWCGYAMCITLPPNRGRRPARVECSRYKPC